MTIVQTSRDGQERPVHTDATDWRVAVEEARAMRDEEWPMWRVQPWDRKERKG